MIPADHSHRRFARDVEQILRSSDVGLRWADNIGDVVEIRYVNAELTIRTDYIPFSVFVLRCEERTKGDFAVESGNRIRWVPAEGGITIESIDVVDTTAEYDVFLGLMRE